MATVGSLVVALMGDISDFQKKMGDAKNSLEDLGASMTSAGISLTKSITLPLVGASGAALHFANEFNSGMANVASLGEEAAGSIEQWGPMVQDLAVTMGESTGDMADGLYQVVSAFGANNETIDILAINAMAAAAGLSSTAEAIALTSAVTKGYGDTSEEAVQKVSDLALKTVQLGQTTFPELAASIGRVTPLSASLGVEMEELFGVMATATGVTGGAAEVSTQLRGVLQSLMAPTETMTGLMDDLGYANGQAMIESMGLQGTIEAIVSAAENSGQPLQAYIGSIEGQTLAMSLAGPQAETFGEKLAEMGAAAGTTAEAFAAQTQGVNEVGFSFEQAKVQMQVWAEQIGAALLPAIQQLMIALTPVVDFIRQMIEQFTALSPQTQMIIIGIVALVAALGPFLAIMGMVVSGIGVLVGAFGLISAPVLLMIGVFVALAAAVIANWDTIQVKIQSAMEFIQAVITTVMTAVQGFWETNGAAIMATAEAVYTQIQAIIETVMAIIESVISTVLSAVQEFWATNGEAIMASVQTTFETVWAIISTIMEAVFAIISFILDAILAFWTAHGAAIMAWVLAVFNIIFSIISVILQAVFVTISTILDSIKAFWEAHGEAIKSSTETVFENIETIITTIMDAVKSFLEAVLALIQGDWDTFGAKMEEVANSMWTAIETVFTTSIEAIKTLITNAVEFIKSAFTSVEWGKIGSGIIDGIKTGIGNAVQGLVDKAVSAAKSAFDAAKAALGIGSPSKLARDFIGKPFIEGLAIGLSDTRPITKAITNSLQHGLINPAANMTGGRGGIDRSLTIQKIVLPAASGNSLIQQLEAARR